jgi:hypothetical protein
MMKKLILGFAVLLSGCTSYEHAPLLFGQAHSVGVNVGTNPANQTPEISVGYKDVDIALIPTIGGSGPNGLIQGSTSADHDAYSTFGQFDVTAKGAEVGLGKFFATGIAARRLADGFACEISRGTDSDCTGRPAF